MNGQYLVILENDSNTNRSAKLRQGLITCEITKEQSTWERIVQTWSDFSRSMMIVPCNCNRRPPSQGGGMLDPAW